VWRAYTGVVCYTLPVCIGPDSEPTKLLYHPRQPDKHLPPGPFTGTFLRKADILGFGVFIGISSMLLAPIDGSKFQLRRIQNNAGITAAILGL